MAFSQQSYTGQGIVQPTERSRVGELLGAGLAGLGAGVGEGIKKFQQNKEEAKELRSNLKRLRSFIPKEEQDEFDSKVEAGSLSDLRGLKRGILERGAMELQQIQLQEAKDKVEAKRQEGKFYSELTGAMQPEDVSVDFARQIDAAEARLQRAQESAGFRPEITYASDQFQAMPDSAQSFAGQPVIRKPLEDRALNIFLRGKESEAAVQDRSIYDMLQESKNIPADFKPTGIQGFAPTRPEPVAEQVYRTAPVRGATEGPEAMPGPSEAVVKAARDLDAIRIQAAEGDTRPETYQETMRRVSESIPELVEKYPTQAKNLYEMLYPKQDKLTPSEQISMMKLQREVQASEVAGYGVAPSVQIAQDFREFAIPTGEGIEKIQELIDIAKQGLAGKLSPENRQRATSIQKRLMGELKEQIVGAGAVSEGEWQILAAVIPDVTKIMSFSDVNIKVLKELQSDLKGKLENRANAISWSPLQGGAVAGQQRPSGKRVSYGMSGQPELQ
jgi:hypothetical protein